MFSQFIIGLILSFLPISELRVGLPLVINYAIKNSIPIAPIFILVLAINISAIFFAFLFLEFVHHRLIKFKFYKNSIGKLITRSKRKADKLEKRMSTIGYLALMFLVAIPLPGTGAWTGVLFSWTLGLNKKKSIIAISAGVMAAGTIILLLSLGFLSL